MSQYLKIDYKLSKAEAALSEILVIQKLVENLNASNLRMKIKKDAIPVGFDKEVSDLNKRLSDIIIKSKSKNAEDKADLDDLLDHLLVGLENFKNKRMKKLNSAISKIEGIEVILKKQALEYLHEIKEFDNQNAKLMKKMESRWNLLNEGEKIVNGF